MELEKIRKNHKYKPVINRSSIVRLENDEFLFAMPIGNGIYKSNDEVKTVKVGETEGSLLDKHLYSVAVKDGAIVYFSPWKAERFFQYDIEQNVSEEINIEGGKQDEYYDLTTFRDNIYAIGLQSLQVYILNKQLKSFMLIRNPKCVRKELSFIRRVKQSNKRAFLDADARKIYVYDITDKSWLEIEGPTDSLKQFFLDENRMWVISNQNEIFCSELDAVLWKKLDISLHGDVTFMQCVGDYINIYFTQGNRYAQLNKQNNVVEYKVLDFLEDGLKHFFNEIDSDTLLIRAYEKRQGLFMNSDEYYWVYNYRKNIAKKYVVEFEDECEERYFQKAVMRQLWDSWWERTQAGLLVETEERTLCQFIDWLNCKENNTTHDEKS